MAMTLKLETLEDVRDWHAHLAAIGDMGTGAIIEAIAENNRKAVKIIDAHLAAQAKVRVSDSIVRYDHCEDAETGNDVGIIPCPNGRFVLLSDVQESFAARLSQGAQGEAEPTFYPWRWRDGAPPHPWSEEWFLAETVYGDRVVLKALPSEYSYDFKTADETYIKSDKIKRWAQFPDSDFVEQKDEPAERAAVPEGFVLVPREPTQEMLNAARDWSLRVNGIGVGHSQATGCYQAMLTAAHQPPEGARVVPDEMLRSAYRRGFLSACDWPEPCYQDTDSEAYRVEREKALKVLLAAPTLAGKEGAK